MTRQAPHPVFIPGDQVTLHHSLGGKGNLRLVVSKFHPPDGPWGEQVECDYPEGTETPPGFPSCFIVRAWQLTAGWGN